ncbi:MAG: succinate dehydrogenase, hydrophobic membrane anchor protein [Pseudomonadota bacterium]
MAHKGTSTFVMQRASAVVLTPLILWFVASVVIHAGDSYADARAWLASPVTKMLFGALITVGAFHMRIGMHEVLADYFHGSLNRIFNTANWVFVVAVVAATWLALFSIGT